MYRCSECRDDSKHWRLGFQSKHRRHQAQPRWSRFHSSCGWRNLCCPEPQYSPNSWAETAGCWHVGIFLLHLKWTRSICHQIGHRSWLLWNWRSSAFRGIGSIASYPQSTWSSWMATPRIMLFLSTVHQDCIYGGNTGTPSGLPKSMRVYRIAWRRALDRAWS